MRTDGLPKRVRGVMGIVAGSLPSTSPDKRSSSFGPLTGSKLRSRLYQVASAKHSKARLPARYANRGDAYNRMTAASKINAPMPPSST